MKSFLKTYLPTLYKVIEFFSHKKVEILEVNPEVGLINPGLTLSFAVAKAAIDAEIRRQKKAGWDGTKISLRRVGRNLGLKDQGTGSVDLGATYAILKSYELVKDEDAGKFVLAVLA